MMKKTKTERIKMIKKNLDKNEELYISGKRSRELYLTCKADGQRAVNRIIHSKPQ